MAQKGSEKGAALQVFVLVSETKTKDTAKPLTQLLSFHVASIASITSSMHSSIVCSLASDLMRVFAYGDSMSCA